MLRKGAREFLVRTGVRGFRRVALSISFISALFAISCSGSLYKVKPPSALPPISTNAARADLGTITIRAEPLLTDEETQELFDSNLQLAGLLPIRVELRHNGGDPADLSKARLQLHDATGTEWKLISSKQAIRRILKANGVSLYNPSARKQFEKDFRAYDLDLRTPLTANQTRTGIVVFQSSQKLPVASPHGLVLTIGSRAQSATLNLN